MEIHLILRVYFTNYLLIYSYLKNSTLSSFTLFMLTIINKIFPNKKDFQIMYGIILIGSTFLLF